VTGKQIQKNLFFVFVVLLTVFSCSRDINTNSESKKSFEKTFSKGPVSMIINVDKTEIKTSDELKIILTAKTKDNWKPSFPELSKNIDKFTVLNIADSDPIKESNNSTTISRIIRLRPFLSGNYTIPALELDYTQGEDKGTLLTDPVQIKVSSLLPEDTKNLVLKDIEEPNTFNIKKLIIYSTIIVIIIIIALFLFLLYKKKKTEKIIPEITPFEQAYNQLNVLLEKNLPGIGEYKEFYFQLNQIVRIYIEKQFNLRAPEQTTEEFLKDLSVSTQIPENFKYVLKDFLMHSDLVKFASHLPEEKEIENSINACKNFIKTTGEAGNNDTPREGEAL